MYGDWIRYQKSYKNINISFSSSLVTLDFNFFCIHTLCFSNEGTEVKTTRFKQVWGIILRALTYKTGKETENKFDEILTCPYVYL